MGPAPSSPLPGVILRASGVTPQKRPPNPMMVAGFRSLKTMLSPWRFHPAPGYLPTPLPAGRVRG
jgi:hypothetical protein